MCACTVACTTPALHCDPVHSDLPWKDRDSHASLHPNWHIVPLLLGKLQPLHWAHLMTELLPVRQHYIAKSNHALLPPMEVHTTCVPAPHLHQLFHCLSTPAPSLHCGKQSRLASPNVTTHYMCTCTTSAPAIPLPEHICASITLRKTMPRIRRVRVTLQTRAESAPQPRRTQRLTPLAFATPWKTQGFARFRPFKPIPARQTATSAWLSYSIACPPALYCEKQSRLASPNVTTQTHISKKTMPRNAQN